METRPTGETKEERRDSNWPTLAMLTYGTFGADSAAGSRYRVQCWTALIVLTVGEAVLTVLYARSHDEWTRRVASFLPGIAFTYIAWSLRGYLLALDELARRMQFEAMAWTYLCGMAGAVFLFGLGISVNPAWFLALEPLRGAWLYVVSKRF